MSINYFVMVLAAFLLGLITVNFSKKIALRSKTLIPKGVPLTGGISIGIVFIILSPLNEVFVSSVIMFLLGMLDDLREMSIKNKFLVQIAATALLISFGVRTHIVSIGNPANILITFIWVLAITNAFNHLDIMDGLAAGVAIISSLGFFIISAINHDAKSAVMSLILIGALFSFLIYNLPPAKVYLGNAGSHFLGFLLASIALIISYAPLERKVALLSPILILGFPVFDTAFVILMRLKKNRNPFKKSDDHLALRILKNGYSQNKTLFLMLSLCVLFVLSGILLSKVPNLFGLVLLILITLVCTAITIKLGK